MSLRQESAATAEDAASATELATAAADAPAATVLAAAMAADRSQGQEDVGGERRRVVFPSELEMDVLVEENADATIRFAIQKQDERHHLHYCSRTFWFESKYEPHNGYDGSPIG